MGERISPSFNVDAGNEYEVDLVVAKPCEAACRSFGRVPQAMSSSGATFFAPSPEAPSCKEFVARTNHIYYSFVLVGISTCKSVSSRRTH